ncbi:MAG: C10 family peptidase [Bacteroidales bacterium]|nr:C10 family peptidase [Bacteroidales bacterium]
MRLRILLFCLLIGCVSGTRALTSAGVPDKTRKSPPPVVNPVFKSDSPNRPASVAPLLSTRWDEDCFYNGSCPADPAATSSCLHTLAGCGAVAMAQIMKYYGYPSHGTGEHGYVHPVYGIQYANFGNTSYTWSAYPDSITGNHEALATLISKCGIAQDMNYGIQSSVSEPANLDSALIKYFGYPKAAAWKNKDDYPLTTWISMLKTELDAGHPLILCGYNYNGSQHRFFICDGYLNDSFHINWGRGGVSDGYFELSNLIPDTIDFSYNQCALFDLTPATPPPANITMDFENIADFSLTFNDWTVNDVDKHATYGITNYTFPHQMEEMAFLCFNPAAVTPSMATDPAIQPHGGQRFGACFSSNPPSNNDWFISPRVQLGTGGSFSFWIKSYNDLYGVDEYQVAISTTDNNPSSFVPLTGATPLQTTTIWSKKVFNLSAYNNQQVYIAIHCVSNDHFLMMIDDLVIQPQAAAFITADFVADKTIVKVGDTVHFTDQSTGAPVSWKWNFTGGIPSTSDQQTPPPVIYTEPGTFAVSLKVSNGTQSDSITRNGYITVNGYPSSMSLDFESLTDFILDFSPWTTLDVNGGDTYGITNVTFPHYMEPMAWICFNPSHTSPPLTNMQAHSCQKLGCCFSSMPPKNPNNKWLISPKLSLAYSPRIEFFVQTYNPLYGDETFNVAVSTTDTDPSSFVTINNNPETAPSTWTKMSYNLADYAHQDVYLGIQCTTNNGFILMLDDINISSLVGTEEQDMESRLFIYPNPASREVIIRTLQPAHGQVLIELVNSLGRVAGSWLHPVENGMITLTVDDIPVGLYLLRFSMGKQELTGKLSIIH